MVASELKVGTPIAELVCVPEPAGLVAVAATLDAVNYTSAWFRSISVN